MQTAQLESDVPAPPDPAPAWDPRTDLSPQAAVTEARVNHCLLWPREV